jgi:hypothetical protein
LWKGEETATKHAKNNDLAACVPFCGASVVVVAHASKRLDEDGPLLRRLAVVGKPATAKGAGLDELQNLKPVRNHAADKVPVVASNRSMNKLKKKKKKPKGGKGREASCAMMSTYSLMPVRVTSTRCSFHTFK